MKRLYATLFLALCAVPACNAQSPSTSSARDHRQHEQLQHQVSDSNTPDIASISRKVLFSVGVMGFIYSCFLIGAHIIAGITASVVSMLCCICAYILEARANISDNKEGFNSVTTQITSFGNKENWGVESVNSVMPSTRCDKSVNASDESDYSKIEDIKATQVRIRCDRTGQYSGNELGDSI